MGFAPGTLKMRLGNLRRLVEYCDLACVDDPKDFTSMHALAFRRWLQGRGQADSVFCQDVVGVRMFCRWCYRKGMMANDLSEELKIRGHYRRLPKNVFRAEQVEQILSGFDLETPHGLRDRAVMEVMYSSAIRRAEMVALRVLDIQWERGLIYIHRGKGGKDRYVPVGARAMEWVRAYLDRVRLRWAPVDDMGWLWLTAAGLPMSSITLGSITKDAYRKAGIDTFGVSCHMLRHTCATLLMENGADIRAVQEILGHQVMESTRIYTHVSQTRAKEVHAKCHPAEQTGQKLA